MHGSTDITGKTDLSVYCLLFSCSALLLLVLSLQLLVLVTNTLILTLHRVRGLDGGDGRAGRREGDGRVGGQWRGWQRRKEGNKREDKEEGERSAR